MEHEKSYEEKIEEQVFSAKDELRICVNRHLTSDGQQWGWISTKKISNERYGYWGNDHERKICANIVHKHNQKLLVNKINTT